MVAKLICSMLAVAYAATPTARESFDAGQYQPALREIARLLSRRDLPPHEDRVELLLLRAECQIRLGSMSLAVGALRDAIEADLPGSRMDRSRATLMLLREADRFVYHPARRVGQATTRPIELRLESDRDVALRALLDDRIAAQRQSVNLLIAKSAEAIAPKKAAEVAEILPLERTVSGNDQQTREILGQLASFIAKGAFETHRASEKLFEELKAASAEIVETEDGRTAPRGVTPSIAQQLAEVARTCDKSARLIDEMAAFTDAERRDQLAEVRTKLATLYEAIVKFAMAGRRT